VGEDRTGPHIQRLTAGQAAERLGVSTEAIRGRIRRGTMRHERVGGRVYVLLPTEQTTDQAADQSELVEELRRQNEYLREENRRKDHLLAAALERIPPQIEAPQEARESPETVEEEPERAEPRPATGEAQGGVQRPWWRRVFGG
jgi:excisionase family DNA binding protein